MHRVGRTGRNGAEGRALSLCTPDDLYLLRDIERLLKGKVSVDTEHPFHVEPPTHAAKPSKKRGRKRPGPQNRQARPGGGHGKRAGGAKTAEGGKPARHSKPGGKKKPATGSKPAGKKPGSRGKRPFNKAKRAAA